MPYIYSEEAPEVKLHGLDVLTRPPDLHRTANANHTASAAKVHQVGGGSSKVAVHATVVLTVAYAYTSHENRLSRAVKPKV